MIKRLAITGLLLMAFVAAFSQAPVQLSELEKRDKLYFKDGKPYTGVCYEKHENGKIAIKGQVKDGMKEGLWTYWYSTGQKKRESTFIDNKKEGLTYYWHENGVKAKELMYKQDKNIDQKLWDSDGNRLPNPAFNSTTD